VPADFSSEDASFRAVAPAQESPWIENRPGEGWLPHLDVRELWAFRELAIAFALKTLRVRYKQTFFGVAWAVLQPILAVVVFTIVFGRLAGLPADGLPYPIFNYSAMILWLYVSASVLAAANSLVDNRELVQKVYFPRLIAPLSAAVPGLVDFAIAFCVLVVLMLAYGVSSGPQVLLTPFWVAGAVAVVLSVGVPFAALNVKYRDVRQVLPLLVQIWLFASPVVYSSSLVPGAWQYVYALNPMVTVLDGFRWSVTGAPPPGPEALVSLAVVVVSLTFGLVYFAREQRSFSDVV
jgi:homopolymeric O-antigen transport system permease protein